MNYTHIIWDWNGTLVDDVDVTVECVNDTLKAYGLPTTDRQEYLDVITPSMEEYYGRMIDLSVHPLTEILSHFQSGYAKRLGKLKLQNGAEDVLNHLKSIGAHQYIVSSFEQSALVRDVNLFNIASLFDEISGAGDILCGSKTDRAKQITDHAKLSGCPVYIGDSISDYNTAKGAGCDCILIAKGHQKKSDLEKLPQYDGYSVRVLDDISQIISII